MRKEYGFTLFDTAIGLCGLVWDDTGLVGIQLPEANQAATRARLLRRFPPAALLAPPAWADAAIEGIRAVIDGESADLSKIPLNWDAVADFDRRVYEAARRIRFGSTATYGEIATAIGEPGGARAVGQALGRNPFPVVVPCHRVVAAGVKLGGFSAAGGLETKQKLLHAEGILGGRQPSLF